MTRLKKSAAILLAMVALAGLMVEQAAAGLHINMTAAAAHLKTVGLSLEAQLLEACSAAKPTLVLISGVGGSQMSGVFAGSQECPPVTNTTVMWFADKWVWGRQMRCWAHHMSLQFDAVTGRWRNSTGTHIWPDYGDVFGAFPENSKQKLFYTFLWRHLFKKHGYIPGVNFFVIPFDWRTGVQGLEQSGGLQKLADDISRAVRINCGKKAIVMSHSYGANVMATVFQKPEFTQWRQKTVSGWIPIGGPFGGSSATAWLVMLAGDFFKLFPLASNLLKPEVSGKWHPTVIGKSIYRFAFGLPSWGWMLPREGVLGINQTLISTPTKNYTVLEQKQLMLDMGDVGGASLLDDSWQRSEKILDHGPVEGLDTYCLYSTGVITPVTLVFNETIPKQQAVTRPSEIIWTTGDGVVELNSLRLCKKLTSADRVVEVSGPLVDHASILSHPQGLHALDNILYKLGVPQENPVAHLVKNLVMP